MGQEEDRSRRALVEAVRALLPRRAWHRVSVRLICETANVSRTTFYAHFDSKQDLLDHAFEALRAGLSAEAVGRGLDRHGNFRCLPALLAHMETHLPLFERNRTSLSGLVLFGQFRRVVDEVMREEIAASVLVAALAGGRPDFVVSGVFGLLERWCGEGCHVPREEILDELDAYVGLVFGAALAEEQPNSRR